MSRTPVLQALFSLALFFGAVFFIDMGAWPVRAEDQLRPLDTRQVQVGGEIGRRIEITINKNVLAINHERDFVQSFRDKNRKPFSYVGLGKEIDALVRLAYFSNDKRLLDLKDRVVRETIQTQLDDGYLGVFATDRLNVWWDVHEMSYLISGLVQDYRYFDHKPSLLSARKAGDYLMQHRPTQPLMFHVSTIGFERAFLSLYRATGDEKYLRHANDQDTLAKWNAPVQDHAYDYLNLCLAQIDLSELRGGEPLTGQGRRVMDYLCRGNGLLVDGTCSRKEGWHNDQLGTGELGETCATAYLLRLYDALLRVEGDSLYADLMERGIYNALFAAQSPDGRELRKYTPLTGKRQYYQGEPSSDFKRDTYCCPNNFRRAIADLPGFIYYQGKNTLLVNLYTPSRATIRLAKDLAIEVRQQTDYPNSGRVVLQVDPQRPAEFSLKLRIPRWCDRASVKINGQATAAPVRPGTFHTLQRTWRAGDRVELDMPMSIRLVQGRATQQGKVAVMRGPLLFCFNPQSNSKQFAGGKNEAPRFDLASIEGPFPDHNVRPDGLALRVKAWSPAADRKAAPTLKLRLTEFADPGGEMTYFPGEDSRLGRVDELFMPHGAGNK